MRPDPIAAAIERAPTETRIFDPRIVRTQILIDGREYIFRASSLVSGCQRRGESGRSILFE